MGLCGRTSGIWQCARVDPAFESTLGTQLAATLGHLSEAVQIQERLATRDPVNHYLYLCLAFLYIRERRLAEAEAAARKAAELSRTGVGVPLILGQVLVRRGEVQAGLAELNRGPLESNRDEGLAWAFQYLGRKPDADVALVRLEDKDASTGAYEISTIRAMRGERDLSFAWLERAYQQHDSSLNDVLTEPDLVNLHQDPRWKPFLRKMNLPE